jgi:PhnB protein
MEVSSYLIFNGQCEAAFKFYEKCLGGKISFIASYAGSPMENQVPAEWGQKIMHATLMVGDKVLMGCDPPPDHFQAPKGFSVSINFDDPVEAERIFKALAEGGTTLMPFQKTFWSPGFGMAIDRFGIPWMANCEQAAN